MKYDITELLLTPGKRIGLDVREEAPESLDESIVAPIAGRLWFYNAVDALLVTGQVQSALEMECSRCLEMYVLPVEVRVDEQFSMGPLPPTVDEESLDIVDLAANILEGMIFDVGELLRQVVLLEAPLKPLCRPDCRGLCPACGHNLNEGDCRCDLRAVSSPFAVLGQRLES